MSVVMSARERVEKANALIGRLARHHRGVARVDTALEQIADLAQVFVAAGRVTGRRQELANALKVDFAELAIAAPSIQATTAAGVKGRDLAMELSPDQIPVATAFRYDLPEQVAGQLGGIDQQLAELLRTAPPGMANVLQQTLASMGISSATPDELSNPQPSPHLRVLRSESWQSALGGVSASDRSKRARDVLNTAGSRCQQTFPGFPSTPAQKWGPDEFRRVMELMGEVAAKTFRNVSVDRALNGQVRLNPLDVLGQAQGIVERVHGATEPLELEVDGALAAALDAVGGQLGGGAQSRDALRQAWTELVNNPDRTTTWGVAPEPLTVVSEPRDKETPSGPDFG